MTLIINPPVNAIPVYPWMIAQDYYVSVLNTVQAAQAAIDPEYGFEVGKNRIRPYISDPTKNMLVNCLIGNREDTNFSRHDKDVQITFMFEFIARANDEGDNFAGEIVGERAQYLSAMIEFGLTALYNNVDPTIDIGAMDPRGSNVKVIDPAEIRKTENLFVFGSYNLDVMFHLTYADYPNLPALTDIFTAISNNTYNFKPA